MHGRRFSSHGLVFTMHILNHSDFYHHDQEIKVEGGSEPIRTYKLPLISEFYLIGVGKS